MEVQSFDTEKRSPNHSRDYEERQPGTREDRLLHLSYCPCGTDTKVTPVKKSPTTSTEAARGPAHDRRQGRAAGPARHLTQQGLPRDPDGLLLPL